MNTSQDITIHHLQVRATKKVASEVVFGIENHTWPSFSRQSQARNTLEWIFIRSLAIKGEKNEITQRAGNAVNDATKAAVNGSTSYASQANAVKFDSLPELLVFLLRDILDNTLLKKWYWSQWYSLSTQTKPQCIAQLLWDNSHYLPALTNHLIRHDLLTAVWQQLTHQSAGEILKRLETVSPLGGEGSVSRSIKINTSVDIINTAEDKVQSINALVNRKLNSITLSLSYWSKALEGISALDHRSRLAFQLIARPLFPRLWREERIVVERLMMDKIHGYQSQPIESMPASANTTGNQHDSLQRSDINRHLTTNKKHYKNISQFDGDNKGAQKTLPNIDDLNDDDPIGELTINDGLSNAHSTSIRSLSDKSVDTAVENSGLENAALFLPQDDIGVINEAMTPDFFTTDGGFFYLINLLARSQYQQILNRDEILYTAWLWLFDLARRFSPEGQAEWFDQTLLNFITEQSELETVAQLLEVEPTAAMTEVEQKLRQEPLLASILNPSLLRIPANIVVTESHIDCFYSMDDMRLDVRMAGLDINPGWVPWLGRIVAFHYQ